MADGKLSAIAASGAHAMSPMPSAVIYDADAPAHRLATLVIGLIDRGTGYQAQLARTPRAAKFDNERAESK